MTHAMLIPALRAHLLADPGVTDLVDTRVWTLELPQSAEYPAIRLAEVSRVLSAHLRGPNDVIDVRVQVDCYAQKGVGDAYALAWAIAEAVAEACVLFVGPLADLEILRLTAGDTTERIDADGARQVVRILCEYFVTFKAAEAA